VAILNIKAQMVIVTMQLREIAYSPSSKTVGAVIEHSYFSLYLCKYF